MERVSGRQVLQCPLFDAVIRRTIEAPKRSSQVNVQVRPWVGYREYVLSRMAGYQFSEAHLPPPEPANMLRIDDPRGIC